MTLFFPPFILAGMRFLHLSDLHFGSQILAERLQALTQDILSQTPDLIVLTGDITDRGFVSQFKTAKSFLDSLGIRFIGVPGNREISPAAILEWMFPRFAMRRYRSFFGQVDRICHVEQDGGPVFFGLNSVHALPSWPGSIARETRYWLKDQAARFPGRAKVLFLHHPVLPVIRSSSYWAHTLSDAGELLNICTQTGIGLILQGHKHRSSIAEVHIPERNAKVVVSAGGAPLMPHWDSTYHVVDLNGSSLVVGRREFRDGRFTDGGTYSFSLDSARPTDNS